MAPQGPLERTFHTIREDSGLGGTFKGHLLQLVWVLEPGQWQVTNLCRSRSWVRGWGLWVKLGLCLILNPTGN